MVLAVSSLLVKNYNFIFWHNLLHPRFYILVKIRRFWLKGTGVKSVMCTCTLYGYNYYIALSAELMA